jgi:hypothetical protein
MKRRGAYPFSPLVAYPEATTARTREAAARRALGLSNEGGR